MKPGIESLIRAMRTGLVTADALAAHLKCEPAELRKPLHNLVERKLAARHGEGEAAEYRLTELGLSWKPGQRGAALRAAMWKTSEGVRA